MDHMEGYSDKVKAKQTLFEMDYICMFSEKMVDALVAEAARALQAPDHAGLDYAAYLLQDALKYDVLYCRARAVPDVDLYNAAQKLNKGQTIENKNW